jgi:hypothetical protein
MSYFAQRKKREKTSIETVSSLPFSDMIVQPPRKQHHKFMRSYLQDCLLLDI